jgi:hypothetical protein
MNKKGVLNMNSKLFKFFLLLLLGIVFSSGNIFAEGDGSQKGNNLSKPLGEPIRAYMNINFISTIIKNDGISDINVGQDASGLIYPRGSGKTAVYTSGFLWGAMVNDPGENDPHIGGTVYRTGLQPGWITSTGQVITESDPRARIYRVRPDVYPGGPSVDVSGEAADEVKSEAAIRAQYELDWTEWPADLGAPYDDVDNDGIYDPTKDVPGVPGASQTIWYVTNDMASSRTNFMYGTEPMGIEMQATFWAYSQTGALGNMYFRRYLIVNKTDALGTNRTFSNMYVSMWSDPDVGDAGDDFAGCDTVLSVSYAYNGKGIDAIYGGTAPAVGFDFFQGPKVVGIAGQDLNKNGIDDANDYAIFKNQKIGPGFINLPMTAAYYYINQDPTLTDPVQGSYSEGAVRFYRFMQGRIGLTNEPFVDPNTGQPSKFTLPGDPVTRTGWIDGQQFGPGDRRIGMASGPFNMAPGDTQEVVVAQIVAGAITGVDRLSAISLMKFYDQIAQVAYDNFFDLPTPAPPPAVTVAELDREIVLDWSKENDKVLATETFDSKGYKFQGYNVYQLPTASSSPSEGVRIATYDIIDGIGKINDLVFDPTTGSVVVLPVQFGNDVGIKRFISIKNDAINQRPLINGIRYYFAVTSYTFNPDPLAVPNNLENPLRILTVIPHSNNPGVTYGEGSGSELEIIHDGTADGGPTVMIVDPTATTGNTYEVTFSQRQEIRDPNGDWVPASTIMRKHHPNDPDTLTGSTIDIAAVYGKSGEIELRCVLNLESVDFNWADGIRMTLPPGVTILSVPTFQALNHDAINSGLIEPIIDGNVIILGDTTHPYSENGPFEGGEEWIIYVSPFTPPIDIDWKIFDDGYSGGPLDEEGTTTVDEIGFLSRLAKYWNLQNVTTSSMLLENQSVIAGTDIFPKRDDIPTNPGLDANPVVDGFQIGVDVVYDSPIEFFKTELIKGDPNSTTNLTNNGGPGNTTDLDIANYTIFSGVVNSWAISNFGVGTSDLNELQKDYELRFTGVWDTMTVGSQTVHYVKSGGQMATVFRMVNAAALANHPLNPNPGVVQRFMVRIPFEIWSIDDNRQVNLSFRHRESNGLENPFYVWDKNRRMYPIIVNSAYDSTTVINIDGGPSPLTDPATWVIVMYSTNYYGTKDVVKLTYANPIQIGIDKYRFKTTASAYSSDLARDQINRINVFPNPYYGINTEELNKYNRFVTFTHLPTSAKVRIFNLAGILVRTIEKQDETQFLRWDLANENGLPVASGLYIAYIELPDLGTTKILKLAIIQEQQILDRF